MNKHLKIRDITLRDGQQSLFATRMTQAQIDRVLPLYKDAGFFSMEVWGGAVPDSVMRYLNEDPWERLDKIKSVIGDTSKLSALSRGRNLFGYNPYPDQVLEGFYKHSIETGIGIMRIFDALNDTVNVASSIKYVKQYGGIPDCAVCYTIDPKIRKREAFLSLITGKHLPPKVFTMEYFAKKVQELERMGAEMITIKDMAGLIPPMKSGLIIKLIKEHTSVPITFHTHSTPGYGLASMLTAILNGVDIVDTCILNFAGGPAGPSFEMVQIFCNKLGIKTGVNLQVVAGINRELKEIRKELEEFDTYKIFPIDFDLSQDALPPAIDALFDAAIDYARQRNEKKLIACTQAIEQYFNFPPPDEIVRTAEIPGGMYTNMLAQLKQLKLEHLLPRVLELVPKVRVNAGCPPLVTPTSQIIGSQAVNCVIDENNGKPFYTTNSVQFVNLVKGLYGKTPVATKRKNCSWSCFPMLHIPFCSKKPKKIIWKPSGQCRKKNGCNTNQKGLNTKNLPPKKGKNDCRKACMVTHGPALTLLKHQHLPLEIQDVFLTAQKEQSPGANTTGLYSILALHFSRLQQA